jgi:uncharacterized membrane protein YczE
MDRPVRRLSQLYAGLALFGFSSALLVESSLGLNPWDVLHQGLSRSVGLSIGTWVLLVGALVLLLWLPLRQRPGIGTVSNVLVIGVALDASLAVLPAPDLLATRVAFLVAGVGLNAVATAGYIGAGLGPGPRDGLMTGLAARGWSVRVVRSLIEVTVLVSGFLLGGTVGVGTVVYALAIGPLVHPLLPLLRVGPRVGPEVRPASAPRRRRRSPAACARTAPSASGPP